MKNRIRVLHLEADPAGAALVNEVLQKDLPDFDRFVLQSGKDFLSVLRSYKPDVILSDNSLPDLSAEEAIGVLKEHEFKIPFIIVTNPVSEEFAARILRLGAADYYLKSDLKHLPGAICRSVEESCQPGKGRGGELKTITETYKLLFEYSPLPNWIYDQDTLEIKDVNQAAINHYGYSREEFLSMTIDLLRPEEEIPKLQKDLELTRNEDGVVRYGKFIHLKKDGSLITVEIYGYRLRYQRANCRLVVSIDVTERENVLRKLENNRQKLLTAQRIAKLGYWERQPGKAESFWTEETYRIWGRQQKSFVPTLDNLYQTIHPDDLDNFKKEQTAAMAGEKELDVEYRIVLPNGLVKWINGIGKLVYNEEGIAVSYEGTVQDITERKKFEESLRISEARHRGIVKSQTNYLTRIDLEGNYSYVNEKFQKDFSWIFPDGQIVGGSAMATVLAYHHELAGKTFQDCIANPNTVFRLEIDKMQKNGKVKTTLWDFACLTDANGNPGEVQGVGIDITDRVRAEKSLRESNERYELVSRATSDAIYDWDCNSGKIYWSEAFSLLFGYAANATSDIDFWMKFVHPDDRDVIESLNDAIAGTCSNWEADYRFRRADGEYAFVVEKGFIIRDENGKALRMVGAIRDVTEKRKLEELLDKASRLARIGSFEIDVLNNTLFWSSVTKAIHEVDEDYVPSLEEGILFYKEGISRETAVNAYMLAKERNVPYEKEIQIVTAKGNERWVRKIGRPQFVNGRCVKISGSFQDITELKTSELQARKASEEKEIILESIGDGFFALDKDWNVTYYNKHAEKLLNCPREYVLGKNLWEVFTDAVDTRFYTYYHKALMENTVQHFEEFFGRVEKWFDVSAFPSRTGLSVYLRDISERKKAENELKELNRNLKNYTRELVTANKGLEQFSYIVSHNLRSPVANILGIANLMESKDYPEEAEGRLFEEVFNNVKRLDTIISDLNNILQTKADLSPRKEWVDLSSLVSSIEEGIQESSKKPGVTIMINFEEVPKLHTVKSYLRSIFYNLIVNSIKYSRTGTPPKIEITAQQQKEENVLTFKDNGLGIDLATKGDQVFGLYKRFHHHVEGKGMGLFMVKTQVELLGGKISVTSEPGRGTEFIIALPANNSIN